MMTATEHLQNYGEVFTRRWVAETLLDLTGYTAEADLGSMRLLEPSCGTGAFLGPAVERLITSAKQHGRNLTDLAGAIRAYDLQPEHAAVAQQLCADLLLAAGLDAAQAARISATWVSAADFLLPGIDETPVDVVVGNPPYIRYDDIPADVVKQYREAWVSMRGRGDIYVGFFERGLALLKPGGRLGYICADRWMRNQYGADLRKVVTDDYAVEHVWTMHDVDAFESEVAAYPAITVLANTKQGNAVVVEATVDFNAASAMGLVEWSSNSPNSDHRLVGGGYTAHKVSHWFTGKEMWPTGDPDRLALVEDLASRFKALGDPSSGTKISIGVASGADAVYVTKDASVVETERLLPLAMRRDLMSGQFDWQGNYLVNPWDDEGNLVDLAEYPRLAEYLGASDKVRNRAVAKKNPARWYRTIDKVTPGLADRPKLLIQDMKSYIHPVLAPEGYYPHHNLYYIVSDEWELEVLGGLLLSRVAQAFIEAYCVRMRGGTLRFQAQYLKKIRVPEPSALTAEQKEGLREAFCSRDVEAATAVASEVYGIEVADFALDD